MWYRNFVNLMESAKDAADEDDRVFFAYCKKHNIKISDLSDEEIKHYYAYALSNRDQYPIPVSEPEYWYHATAKSSLKNIFANGLTPSENTNGRALVSHSLGRIFFTDNISNAMFYGLRANRSYILLRVKREFVIDPHVDSEDSDSIFTTHSIPADHIEMWNGSAWVLI